ncbi:E3 ubiquitin-protein ligase UHRF1-like [Trichogramma pretiosum]|uniref:E3 ubiquitin-protein ligase UHRF1-like n=1 Tax=Trichogramma pretiosum TaxID=7493 RepID=UPI0006C93EE3|nr:E3 ubiquitin-protein ligase UHRF1-like [Trichogramma pretiosum]
MTYLRCQTLSGSSVNYVEFHKRMKVEGLKKELASRLNVPSKRLLLFFNDRYLDADYNLTRFNIRALDTIEVMIMPPGLTINRLRFVGPVSGYDVGRKFSRRELFEYGLHREKQCGIYANPGNQAYSIILSRKFKGDLDSGNVIVYCGQRGSDPNKITMTNKTRALARNCNVELCEDGSLTVANAWRHGGPVRVYKQIRDRIYEYAGVYKVVGYWLTTVNGHNTWKFRLIKDPDHEHTSYEPYN